MNKNAKGIGFYLLLGIMFLLLAFSLKESFDSRSTCTYREFEEMLEEGQVAKVEVVQNQATPTGVLEITKTDGTEETVNVSDVNTAQELVSKYDKVFLEVRDVEKESVFLTTVLPILLMGGFLLFFMAMYRRRGTEQMNIY